MLSRFASHRQRLACGVAAVDRRAFWRSSTPPLVPSVMYEDNHLLVLAKPACMPSVPDESGGARWTTPLHTNMLTSRAPSPLLCIPALPLEVPPNSGSPPPSEHTHHDHHDLTAFLSPHPPGDHSLLEWGKAYIRKAYNKPGEAWLAPVHRIDRPVSGVVCFARTSKAADRLSEQVSRESSLSPRPP